MPYPLPHIKDMFKRVSSFTYATTLDLIISYYNILLTDASNKLCTVTTSFGKYKYNPLKMGVCIAPDIFLEQMSTLMDDLELVRFHLSDFLVITSGSFEEHLAKVKEVMKQLQSVGLKFKADKCKFAVPKIE